MAPVQATQAAESVEQKFQRLAAVWRAETGHLSSLTKMVSHPAYQEIIALGPEVVPSLLRDLEREPDHWFAALRAITGAQPVPPEDRGRIEALLTTRADANPAHLYMAAIWTPSGVLPYIPNQTGSIIPAGLPRAQVIAQFDPERLHAAGDGAGAAASDAEDDDGAVWRGHRLGVSSSSRAGRGHGARGRGRRCAPRR